MRISDWSSGVCSSDLPARFRSGAADKWPSDRGTCAPRRQHGRLPPDDDRSVAGGRERLRRRTYIVRHRVAEPRRRRIAASATGNQPVTGAHRQAAVPNPDSDGRAIPCRSEEHTSELQSLMRNSYAVCCLQKKTKQIIPVNKTNI